MMNSKLSGLGGLWFKVKGFKVSRFKDKGLRIMVKGFNQLQPLNPLNPL